MCVCMCACLILIVCLTFCYNVICMNNDMCGCLCVQLGNRKGLLHVCVYCYYVIITFCYKVRKIQEKNL